jgi:nucleoside-diphosphate-sugar epimerase
MTTRVLVTGGAGFVGSHLVEACLKRGYEVRALDNLSLGKTGWVDANAELIEGDIRDFEVCKRAVQNCSGVFHLAAMSRSAASLDNIDICTTNNIIGTQNILSAARDAGVQKVVYSGSSTYYGNLPPPHREEMRPDYLNFYGLSKHVGEEYTLLFDRLYGLHGNVLRYFNVYGPRLSGEGQYALVMSIFFRLLKEGKPLTIHGSGQQARDFVHVRDVAQANILAFENAAHGRVYNVGSGVAVSVKELADSLSTNLVYEPRRAGDAEITLADISRIKDELGWTPQVSFADGLKELIEEAQIPLDRIPNGSR